jgi:hypothetical protein|tara:strand:- start:3666 stop:3989 length:324 start_codon:yes stop_codon:yes gene_type:complete
MSASTTGSSSSSQSASNYRLPCNSALQHASKIAIVEDKPIMLDYWTLSQEGKIIIGMKEDGEKLIVKSEDEYTSPIVKIYKVETEYLILTENSIYVVDVKCPTRKIS